MDLLIYVSFILKLCNKVIICEDIKGKHNCDIKLLGSHFLVIFMLFCYIYMYSNHVPLYCIAVLGVRTKLGFYK